MKVWSRVLSLQDFHDCAREVNDDFPGAAVYLAHGLALHNGPRSRRFEGVSLRSMYGSRAPNPGGGSRDVSGERAASWTEWGWFLARVFERDPDARAGDYRHREDFHEQTYERFREPRSPRELQVRRAVRAVA